MYSPLPDFPHLALCIATVGRIRELDRLLTSLEQQTCTDFHIYLADQNAPGTLDALRKGRKAARYRWRMFVERLRHFSS